MSSAEEAAPSTSRLVRNKDEPSKLRRFGRFLYNSERRTCLGRSAKSWLEITIFYIIFYTCLALKMVAVVKIFYTTVETTHPKLQGKDSLLKGMPGLVATRENVHDSRKKLSNVAEPPSIKFSSGSSSSYQPFVQEIEDRLKGFNETLDQLEREGEALAGRKCERADSPFTCRRGWELLRRWRNETRECSSENDYGYSSGQPCVLLTLNKVYGWVPTLGGKLAVKVSCTRRKGAEPGNFKFVPADAFPSYFYPFRFNDDFVSYPIFIRFESPPTSATVIECEPLDDQIELDTEQRYNTHGYAVFSLSVTG